MAKQQDIERKYVGDAANTSGEEVMSVAVNELFRKTKKSVSNVDGKNVLNAKD